MARRRRSDSCLSDMSDAKVPGSSTDSSSQKVPAINKVTNTKQLSDEAPREGMVLHLFVEVIQEFI